MNRFITVVLLFCPVLFLQCKNSTVDDIDEIKKLLLQERKAHFEKNIDLLFSHSADTVTEINKGIVSKGPAEMNRSHFANYFSQVNFIKWDDVAEPDKVFPGSFTCIRHRSKNGCFANVTGETIGYYSFCLGFYF